MTAQQTIGPASTPPSAAASRIIDCDIHESPKSLKELVPYLEPKFRRFITESMYEPEYCRPHRQVTPSGTYRADSWAPDGSRPGTDTDFVRAQLLDECKEQFGILCGSLRIDASGTAPSWVEFKTSLMSAYNDWIVDKWLSADERFVASIHINAHDPEGAVREIERLASHPRLVQVMIYLGQRGFGEPYYHSIYEAAERHNLVVAMHHCMNAQPALGWGRYYVEWTTGLPQVLQSQLTSLVFNGVFEKFPRLKMMMVEVGFTWVPSYLWRLDQRYRELRAEVPWLNRLPSQMIRDQVRFTTQPTEPLTTKQLLQIFEQLESDDMVCFSTDYPHWDFDSPTAALPAGLSETLKQKIFRENALQWYDKLQVLAGLNTQAQQPAGAEQNALRA